MLFTPCADGVSREIVATGYTATIETYGVGNMVWVRKQVQKNIYIHNDLANTADHIRKRVEEMEATGNREGIALDITACLTMLAFTFESRMNFVGAKRVAGWSERRPFGKKLGNVLEKLGITPDLTERPYSTVGELKTFRDIIAHGKPDESEIDELVESDGTFDDLATDLRGVWEAHLTVEFMRQCFEDLDAIWHDWLERAGIGRYETITHGSHEISLEEALKAFQPKA